tara:strand:- start:1303 stop:1932 length:630 start_codon:yes stop_codon:yes gene_type:complete
LKSFFLFIIFVIYSGLLIILGTSLNHNLIFNQNKNENEQKVYYKHFCISKDRICVLYKYTFDEKLRIRVSARPGKKYLPTHLIPNYDIKVNLWENKPLTLEQSKKLNELFEDFYVEYEKNKYFNKITKSNTNFFTIQFRDKNDFSIHSTTFHLANRDDAISSNGIVSAFQFEAEEEISSFLFNRIDHSKDEISWSTALGKELDFLEESY